MSGAIYIIPEMERPIHPKPETMNKFVRKFCVQFCELTISWHITSAADLRMTLLCQPEMLEVLAAKVTSVEGGCCQEREFAANRSDEMKKIYHLLLNRVVKLKK
jgi:hypothetical protein